MAALVLSVAGAWAGSALGGGFLQSAGTLLGAALGSVIDQELFAKDKAPAEATQGARVSDFRMSGSAYGQVVPRVWGRGRLPANIIWLRGIREVMITEFERVRGAGKGGNRAKRTAKTRVEYRADLLLSICEAPITAVHRIWINNQPLNPEHVGELRIHYGEEGQAADPLIAAVEGADRSPAYRGLVTIMLEDFNLTPHGNRIPNIDVEILNASGGYRPQIEAICLIPASGEFVYDTDIVSKLSYATASARPINANSGQRRADFAVAIDNLRRELPNVQWINLVYAWFGTSTDVATCGLRPACEYLLTEAGAYGPETQPHLWSVAGRGRAFWPKVSSITLPDGTTQISYGGTVSDGAVIRAVQHLRGLGYKVLFYPFIMMDVPPPAPEPFPWRGRITGSADAVPGFFTRPDGYLRFVGHCMTLCEAAGGIDAFAIGSEMVGLNRIHDENGDYPAVPFWRQIAAEAKSRLGADCVVTYAADWSEYRYHDRGGGNVDFPLDTLWADENIDVVGIDAYFPVSDEPRSVTESAAIVAGWGGGELIDYYYATPADRDLPGRGVNRIRTPIDDPFYAIKDLRGWWDSDHVPRLAGIPTGPTTDWQPKLKPIWFTEYGFPSVHCATNQPNVFIDPKSSESYAPYYSHGSVDPVVQRAAIKGTEDFWRDPARNPLDDFGRRMVGQRFLWAWDARPYPFFPSLGSVWRDGDNYRLGHWVQGKVGGMQLSDIVADLCLAAGLNSSEFDVSSLTDDVAGYVVGERKTIREAIAVLQTAYFFDAVETGGVLRFVKRGEGTVVAVSASDLGAAEGDGDRARIRIERSQDIELPIAVDVVHLDESRDYQSSSVSVRRQIGETRSVTTYSLPIVMSVEQAQSVGQQALREIWMGRVACEAKLPTRAILIDPTDVIEFPVDGVTQRFRVTSVTYGKPGLVLVRGVATDGAMPQFVTVPTGSGSIEPNLPVSAPPTRAELMDLPLLSEDHVGSAASFYFAACSLGGAPFRGVSLFRPTSDGLDYAVAATAEAPSTIGDTLTVLAAGSTSSFDRANSVEVQLACGTLESATDERLLDGANAVVIGNEILQFGSAELLGPGRYRLSRLLRGRLGSEDRVVTHPVGTRFVLLDLGRQVRPQFSTQGIDLPIAWRYAPLPQGPSGDQAVTVTFTNEGEGLRPWSPVHLRGVRDPAGNLNLTWVRRTRFGGWWLDRGDVPLHEEREAYEIDILAGANVRRTLTADQPAATYSAAEQIADFGSLQASVAVKIYQMSGAIGRGRPGAATL